MESPLFSSVFQSMLEDFSLKVISYTEALCISDWFQGVVEYNGCSSKWLLTTGFECKHLSSWRLLTVNKREMVMTDKKISACCVLGTIPLAGLFSFLSHWSWPWNCPHCDSVLNDATEVLITDLLI